MFFPFPFFLSPSLTHSLVASRSFPFSPSRSFARSACISLQPLFARSYYLILGRS
jgi:hypothetical protein